MRECLDKKFVVFENQMEFQVHQVEEHGHLLSNRERRDALRIDTSFMYGDDAGPSRSRRGGKKTRENRDAAASSSSGPATLQARRAQFGATLTVDSNEADQYWETVLSVLNDSERKLAACKGALQGYRASELPATDLLHTVMNLTGEDPGSTDLIVQSMAEILGSSEKRAELLAAWARVKTQHTSFPSLASTAAAPADLHSMRSLKSAASGNDRVWENVARAASSQPPTRSQSHFPQLSSSGPRIVPQTAPRMVPGSAAHSISSLQRTQARGNGAVGGSAWSNKATPQTTNPAAFPPLGSAPARPKPHSVPAPAARANAPSRSALSANQFPSLPTSSAHAERQAQKRELFGDRNAPPPSRWGSRPTAASNSSEFPSLGSVAHSLPEPVQGGKQRRKKGILLSSVGSMHHG